MLSVKKKSYWSIRRAKLANLLAYNVDYGSGSRPSGSFHHAQECGLLSEVVSEAMGSATCNDEPIIAEATETVDYSFEIGAEASDSDNSSYDCSLSDENLQKSLFDWAVQFNITFTALGKLLGMLNQYHPDLPLDPRTLMQTPKDLPVTQLSNGGTYSHLGIAHTIVKLHSAEFLSKCIEKGEILLQLNVDGLPIYKSSGFQLWPILGMVKGTPDEKPFTIGVYAGTKKPDPVFEFLEEFVTEARHLEKNGIVVGDKTCNFGIHSIVCDAPARALIKNIKSHSGYNACERCTQKGEWHGKIVYPFASDSQLRTDMSFGEMRDSEHHRGPSPLNQLNVGLVSQVCLDYMHLICLGITRRLILTWMRGPLASRLSASCVAQISANLESLKDCIPCEFARKPRTLTDVDRWKATEFRQFLLYTGPVVLKNFLHDSLYKHFMLLSVGIFLCVNPGLCMQFAEYARSLFLLFVQHAPQLYGLDILVYNVHCLLHIVDDVVRFGPLDNISAFPFENHMRMFKKMIRGPRSPLKQVIARLTERENTCFRTSMSSTTLKGLHIYGPLPESWKDFANVTQYNAMQLHDLTLKTSQKDGCVALACGNICVIKNIVQRDCEVFIIYQQFLQKKSFYDYPLQSQDLGIFEVSQLSVLLEVASVSEITHKYVCMKNLRQNSTFIAVPLAHLNKA